ncbi:hypothetical protein CC1G_00992 [Coprinopsis cinerea okayama7|uniref:Uncharacterized protein n=1 Tax=Coprinopsis cinerea (strain Okayama-7 / 130 / ATCC MYA-4618 / FGSC 9003) TaxID=240176 RepID=A8N9B7_COPC7|nr:hypothetical protein CC1G_00992 [Coprinopsis cinerea okayama7\|eukprot:XP_001831445.1 hypothetical protein CC1G_00992 [Coprinopsis cinerea okayama7\
MLSPAKENWRAAINRVTNQPASGKPRTTRCAHQIRERLYLSDYWTAKDAEEIGKLGITHIVSVIDRPPTQLPESIPQSNRLQVSIKDYSDADILVHLEETTNFIARVLAENDTNKVLVHCLQGISRSATVVCAYLIATEGMQSHEAIEHVQSIRNVVCPNLGFRLQLLQYADRFPKKEEQRMSPVVTEFVQRIRKALAMPSKRSSKEVQTPSLPVVPAAGAS